MEGQQTTEEEEKKRTKKKKKRRKEKEEAHRMEWKKEWEFSKSRNRDGVQHVVGFIILVCVCAIFLPRRRRRRRRCLHSKWFSALSSRVRCSSAILIRLMRACPLFIFSRISTRIRFAIVVVGVIWCCLLLLLPFLCMCDVCVCVIFWWRQWRRCGDFHFVFRIRFLAFVVVVVRHPLPVLPVCECICI